MKFRQIVNAIYGDNYAKYYIRRKIKRIFSRNKDDFYWDIYTYHYRGEMESLAKNHTLLLRENDYYFSSDGHLSQRNMTIKPLHPNWRILYETILQLSPSSVLEAGCGNGMNLFNLKVLSPQLRLYGLDRSVKQIEYLREFTPDLDAEIRQIDLTGHYSNGLLSHPVDICYTQAVIMHIKDGNNHLKAMTNMFNCAVKQVILLENWKHHQLMDDIKQLHNDGEIKWDKINFYYRYSNEYQKPHVMICSPVTLNYPVLENYDILVKGVTET